jgi:hypothetical protein
MAIDIRAEVLCSLGTIISGSIGDDYLQGSGLIKTQGSVLISGLITPAIGTIVTFTYVKQGITRKIPRKMRVLSSFADPFRRTTQVELGCKLTYLSDLKESVKWFVFDDPLNEEFTEEDAAIVTLPISAVSVASRCLSEIGITATSIPLTSRFSIPEFDFSPGYVDILSGLLVSESYFGYLDRNEVLQVQSLDQDGGTGPVFTKQDIIDIGSIGVGSLPGEAVTVTYSTLVLSVPTVEEAEAAGEEPGEGGVEALVDPEDPELTSEEKEKAKDRKEEQERINWERIDTSSTPQSFYVSYTRAIEGVSTNLVETYSGAFSSSTTTSYMIVSGGKEVPSSRTTTNLGPSISVLSSAAQQYLQNGISFNNVNLTLSTSTETFSYDGDGNQTGSIKTTVQSEAAVLGAAALKWADPSAFYTINYGGSVITERVEQSSQTTSGFTRETTTTYLLHSLTQDGQQGIANATQDATVLDTPSIAGAILSGGLSHSDTSTTTTRRGTASSQSRPSQADRNNEAYAKRPSGGTVSVYDPAVIDGVPPEDTTTSAGLDGDPDESTDPNNGYSTKSSSEIVLALGSAAAERRIEFSLPYAPDDRFWGFSGGPFFSIRSNAASIARRYGRVQNRLLLGNRNGISMQIAPERMPAAPFSPITVKANGLSALYRVNGASWAFDANGIVASMDALFWGATGGTGDFWFPVAPGIVSLPESPTVVDTSPDLVIGTVETVGSTPQTVLNAAFPEAIAGDGVQDEATGNFWTYDDTIWTNVGETPGPTSAITSVVLPYSETSVYTGRLRPIIEVTKFTYGMQLFTEIPPITVKLRLNIAKTSPSVTYSFSCLSPVVLTDLVLLVPTVGQSMITWQPYVNDLKISIPSVSFSIVALEPGAGGG